MSINSNKSKHGSKFSLRNLMGRKNKNSSNESIFQHSLSVADSQSFQERILQQSLEGNVEPDIAANSDGSHSDHDSTISSVGREQLVSSHEEEEEDEKEEIPSEIKPGLDLNNGVLELSVPNHNRRTALRAEESTRTGMISDVTTDIPSIFSSTAGSSGDKTTPLPTTAAPPPQTLEGFREHSTMSLISDKSHNFDAAPPVLVTHENRWGQFDTEDIETEAYRASASAIANCAANYAVRYAKRYSTLTEDDDEKEDLSRHSNLSDSRHSVLSSVAKSRSSGGKRSSTGTISNGSGHKNNPRGYRSMSLDIADDNDTLQAPLKAANRDESLQTHNNEAAEAKLSSSDKMPNEWNNLDPDGENRVKYDVERSNLLRAKLEQLVQDADWKRADAGSLRDTPSVSASLHTKEDGRESEPEEEDDDDDDDSEDDDSDDDYDGNKNPSSSSDSRSSSDGHVFDSKLENEILSDAILMSDSKDPKLMSKINVIDEHSSYKIRGLTTTDSKRSEATSSSGHFSSDGAIKTRSEMMLHIQQSNNLISDMTMFDLQDELEQRSKFQSDEDKSEAKIPRNQIDSEIPMQMKSNSNEFDEQNCNEIDAKVSDNSYQDELSESDCSDNSTLESDVEDINHALRLMTATREMIRSSFSSGHVSDSFDHSSHPDEIETDVTANRRSSTGGESIESVFTPSKAKALIAKRSFIIQADEDTISASLHGVNDEGQVYNLRGNSEENNLIENSIPNHDNGHPFRANELSNQSSSENTSSDEDDHTPLDDATKMTHQIDDEVEPKSAPDLFIDSDIALLHSQLSQRNASHSFPNGSRLYHQDSTDNAFNAYAQSSESESDGLLLSNREGIASGASSTSSGSSSNKTYNYDKAYELNTSNSDWHGNSNDGRDQVQGDSSDSDSDQSSDDYGVYSNREPSRTSFSDTSSLAQSLTSLEKTFSVSKYTSGHSSSSAESDDASESSVIEYNSFPHDRRVESEEYEASSANNELSASQFEENNNIMHSSTRHERFDNQMKVDQEAENDRTRTDNNDLITSQKKEESQSLGTIVEESPLSAKDRGSNDIRNNGANDSHLPINESEESSERNSEWTDISSRSDTWSAMGKVPEPVVIIPLNTTNFLLRRTFLSDRVLNSRGDMDSYKDRTYSRRRSNSYENIQVTEFCSKEDGTAVDNKFIRSQSDEYVDCARGSKARAAVLFRMINDVSEKVQNVNGSKPQTMVEKDKAANEREVERGYNSSQVPMALVECSDNSVDRTVGESTFSHFSRKYSHDEGDDSESRSHEDLDGNNHMMHSMHSMHSKDDEVSTPTTLPSTIQKFDDEDAGYMPWPGENSVSSNGSQEEQSLAPQCTEDESSGGSFVEFWPNRGANIDLAMKHSQVQDQINPKKVPLNVPCSHLSEGDEKDSHVEVKEDGIEGALSDANRYENYQDAMPAKRDQSDSSRSDKCSDIVSTNCDEDILSDSNGSFSNADSVGRNNQHLKENSGVNQLSYDHVPVLSDAEIDKETSEDFCQISTSSHLKEEEEGRKFEHVQLKSQGLLKEKSQSRNITVDVKEALSESTDESLAHHITIESEVDESYFEPENTTIDPNTAFSEDFLPPTKSVPEDDGSSIIGTEDNQHRSNSASPVEDSPNIRRDPDNNSNEDGSMSGLGSQDFWVRDRDVSDEEGNSANNPLNINKSEQTFGVFTNQEECASISSQCLDKDSRMMKSEQCNGNTETKMKKDGAGYDHSCESSTSGVYKCTRKNMSAGSDEIGDTDECIPQSSGISLDRGSSKNGTERNLDSPLGSDNQGDDQEPVKNASSSMPTCRNTNNGTGADKKQISDGNCDSHSKDEIHPGFRKTSEEQLGCDENRSLGSADNQCCKPSSKDISDFTLQHVADDENSSDRDEIDESVGHSSADSQCSELSSTNACSLVKTIDKCDECIIDNIQSGIHAVTDNDSRLSERDSEHENRTPDVDVPIEDTFSAGKDNTRDFRKINDKSSESSKSSATYSDDEHQSPLTLANTLQQNNHDDFGSNPNIASLNGNDTASDNDISIHSVGSNISSGNGSGHTEESSSTESRSSPRIANEALAISGSTRSTGSKNNASNEIRRSTENAHNVPRHGSRTSLVSLHSTTSSRSLGNRSETDRGSNSSRRSVLSATIISVSGRSLRHGTYEELGSDSSRRSLHSAVAALDRDRDNGNNSFRSIYSAQSSISGSARKLGAKDNDAENVNSSSRSLHSGVGSDNSQNERANNDNNDQDSDSSHDSLHSGNDASEGNDGDDSDHSQEGDLDSSQKSLSSESGASKSNKSDDKDGGDSNKSFSSRSSSSKGNNSDRNNDGDLNSSQKSLSSKSAISVTGQNSSQKSLSSRDAELANSGIDASSNLGQISLQKENTASANSDNDDNANEGNWNSGKKILDSEGDESGSGSKANELSSNCLYSKTNDDTNSANAANDVDESTMSQGLESKNFGDEGNDDDQDSSEASSSKIIDDSKNSNFTDKEAEASTSSGNIVSNISSEPTKIDEGLHDALGHTNESKHLDSCDGSNISNMNDESGWSSGAETPAEESEPLLFPDSASSSTVSGILMQSNNSTLDSLYDAFHIEPLSTKEDELKSMDEKDESVVQTGEPSTRGKSSNQKVTFALESGGNDATISASKVMESDESSRLYQSDESPERDIESGLQSSSDCEPQNNEKEPLVRVEDSAGGGNNNQHGSSRQRNPGQAYQLQTFYASRCTKFVFFMALFLMAMSSVVTVLLVMKRGDPVPLMKTNNKNGIGGNGGNGGSGGTPGQGESGNVDVVPPRDDEDDKFAAKLWEEHTIVAPIEPLDDKAGSSVAISNDGERLVIGARRFSTLGLSQNGIVRIYKINSSVNEWEEVKNFIGMRTMDQFGTSIALSGNGEVLAAGAPGYDSTGGFPTNEGIVYIYDLSDNDASKWKWISSIEGKDVGEQCGTSVSLERGGQHLAIGSPLRYKAKGSVTVYMKAPRGDWYQVGDILNGTVVDDLFGSSLSIARDGLQLAVGAPSRTSPGNAGYVKVYRHKVEGWEELQRIESSTIEEFGKSIAQTPDGTKLIVGAPAADQQRGFIKVYSKNEELFSQLGDTLNGFDAKDRFGSSVAFSSDGSRFGVGIPGRGINLQQATGSTIVYRINEADPIIVSSKEIYGENGEDFGSSIALNGNGSLFVVGSPSKEITRTFI